MKLTKNQLRELNIYNAHNYANGSPYINYYPAQTGRAHKSASWQIIWPGHSFDGPWYDYGKLVYSIPQPSIDRAKIFQQATTKFIELFSANELAKTPFGSWMDAEFVKTRNAELSVKLKDNQKGDTNVS